jgi:hypothetical protein
LSRIQGHVASFFHFTCYTLQDAEADGCAYVELRSTPRASSTMSSPKAKFANLSTLTALLQVRTAVYAHRVRHHAGLPFFSSSTNSETTKQITLSYVSLKF